MEKQTKIQQTTNQQETLEEKKKTINWISFFTAGYFVFFGVLSIFNKNYEFLYYVIVIVLLMIVIIIYYRTIQLNKYLLWGLATLGAMHFFGGNLRIGAKRLYDIYIIPPNILKYDNIVHAFGIFVATFVVYNLLKPYLHPDIIQNKFIFSLILTLIVMGIGAFNEIIELVAVLIFKVQNLVGDYYNNAFDLVYNFVGALIACYIIIYKNKKGTL